MNKESHPKSPEALAPILGNSETDKQLEAIKQTFEKSSEDIKQPSTKETRKKIEKLAISTELTNQQELSNQAADNTVYSTKKEKDSTYKHTMDDLQEALRPTQRIFSKLIHSPTVENASEVAGKTLGRPSLLLGGFLTTTVGTFIIYSVAKRNGYTVDSHFIVLALFIAGAVCGLLFELLTTSLRKILHKN